MKNSLLVLCSVAFVTTVTVFAYNSDKGPTKETEGISELPAPATDSLVERGKKLITPMHYSQEDLKAIAAYLNKR
ncbi:MAG: hypothetical protein ACXVBJ_08840 [Flavisolibacter sp.]